jgi:DNA-directed RNA polymerase specialized sigma24 family protein
MADVWRDWGSDEWRQRLVAYDETARRAVVAISLGTCRWKLDRDGWGRYLSHGDIEEIAYDTLDKIEARAAQEPQIDAMRAYIKVVALNALRDRMKHLALSTSRPDTSELPIRDHQAEAVMITVEGTEGTEGTDDARSALSRTLRACYDQLKPEKRQIMDVQEMPREWIITSLQLKMNVNALNVEIFRIKKRLASCLERMGYSLDRVMAILRWGGAA